MSTLSEQIKSLPPELGEPVAAVNGDFYFDSKYPGDPRDLQIRRGEIISAPAGHACFWIDPSGNPAKDGNEDGQSDNAENNSSDGDQAEEHAARVSYNSR